MRIPIITGLLLGLASPLAAATLTPGDGRGFSELSRVMENGRACGTAPSPARPGRLEEAGDAIRFSLSAKSRVQPLGVTSEIVEGTGFLDENRDLLDDDPRRSVELFDFPSDAPEDAAGAETDDAGPGRRAGATQDAGRCGMLLS